MSAIPDYHEVRMTLTEVDTLLQHYVGDSTVINIGETIRIMLGEYFYGEPPTTMYPCHTQMDRTLVWPLFGQTLFGQELDNAIDVMGDMFWTLADTITNNALAVNDGYVHRPNECFYKFFPESRVLAVYTPVITGIIHTLNIAPLAGLAVMETCRSTLPSWLVFK